MADKQDVVIVDVVKTREDVEEKYSGRWLGEKINMMLIDFKELLKDYKYIVIHSEIYEMIKQHYMGKVIADIDINLLKSFLIIPKFEVHTVKFY